MCCTKQKISIQLLLVLPLSLIVCLIRFNYLFVITAPLYLLDPDFVSMAVFPGLVVIHSAIVFLPLILSSVMFISQL